MMNKIFEKRWTLGGILIFLCTIFEIHGSSISIYSDLLGHSELSDVVLGKCRPIRSDEWEVFTPFAFSQYFNNFSLISDIVRGAPTNMFMTYGQAVWHPAIIFRPAQIGFLFFDQGSGLAFFWMSRLIILFLISFEFARLILKVDKKYAIIYAIMVAFSPLAQWWWAVNSIAEILAAGQGVVVTWFLYLKNFEEKKSFLYLVGFLYCAGVFIFGIYPAWQVTFGYLFLICIVAVSFTHSCTLKILWRDKFLWLIGFAVMLAPIAHAIYISKDMIELQMATEYPGKRFTTGGFLSLLDTLKFLLYYGASVLTPFVSMEHDLTNECELSSFFTMMPLGFLMFFYIRFKLKQKDFLMTCLFALIILFIIWEVMTMPDWISKYTFMSKTIPNRIRSAIDFAQLLMFFRGVTLIKNFPNPCIRFILAGVTAALSTIAIYNVFIFPSISLFFVFFFISVSVFLFLTPMNKKVFSALAVMMLVLGITVNPINVGADAVYKEPVGQKIAEIVQTEVDGGKTKSLWIVEDDGVSYNNFPIMFGAPTINSVNIYPYFERWKKLDSEGKYFKIYNRYAHIQISLTKTPTIFYMSGVDSFRVKLNVNDLSKLNARYIFSTNNHLENFSTPQVKIQKIFEDAGRFIYRIEEIDE